MRALKAERPAKVYFGTYSLGARPRVCFFQYYDFREKREAHQKKKRQKTETAQKPRSDALG